MKRDIKDKLFRYVKEGRVKRIRSVLKKHKGIELDGFVDSRQRTLLHISCLLGEHAVVKVLIKSGARLDLQDVEGNTPLHLALTHALQVLTDAVYHDLVEPIWQNATKTLLRQPNNDGETARDLKKKFKWELRKRREDRKMYEEEQERNLGEANREVNYEKEWNEKLFFEMGNDEGELFSCVDDYDSNNETYDQWVDRIAREKHQKHFVNNKRHTKTDQRERERRNREACEQTRYLQEQHEAYIKEMSQRRAKYRSTVQKEQYEDKCNIVFDLKGTTLLRYSDIPWPCDGDVSDMIKMIKTWSESEDDGKKFLKDQRIRWHPDRFIQKCADRLDAEEKETVMTAVNQLSQGINALIDSKE